MRLITKFTIWFVLIAALVFTAGGIILLYMVEAELIHEESRKLTDTVELIAKHLEEGTEEEDIEGLKVSIEERDFSEPTIPLTITDTFAYFIPHQHNERALKAQASFKMNRKHYFISTFSYIGESDDIAQGITQSLVITFVLLLVLVVIANMIISKKIFSPFNETLEIIKTFNLKQKENIDLPSTNTKEFKELNMFLSNMIAKSTEDYRLLKEFSENASHELQTPLSIIRGKLELLMETDISEEQASFISTIHNEVKRLSSINHSLTLLTKLENHEYEPSTIHFSDLVNTTLKNFEELIAIKSLTVEKTIEDEVYLPINQFLAEILLNNLLSNAIRHNVDDGKIVIELTANTLVISNTGNLPELKSGDMFRRFKKTTQNSNSIGLGLAIVKQICELSLIKIDYNYENNVHIFRLLFSRK